MKIWIVLKLWSDEKTWMDYSKIVGVFSTLEKAEHARTMEYEYSTEETDVSIEVHELEVDEFRGEKL